MRVEINTYYIKKNDKCFIDAAYVSITLGLPLGTVLLKRREKAYDYHFYSEDYMKGIS